MPKNFIKDPIPTPRRVQHRGGGEGGPEAGNCEDYRRNSCKGWLIFCQWGNRRRVGCPVKFRFSHEAKRNYKNRSEKSYLAHL